MLYNQIVEINKKFNNNVSGVDFLMNANDDANNNSKGYLNSAANTLTNAFGIIKSEGEKDLASSAKVLDKLKV